MKKENSKKIDIRDIVGNLTQEDLTGLNGISKNGLISLVENILQEIMSKEKQEYLLETSFDKSNGSYHRTLNTSLGKLNLNVPRVRSGKFRSSLLPQKYRPSEATTPQRSEDQDMMNHLRSLFLLFW